MADGVTDLRLSAWSLVPLVTLILAEVHSRWVVLHTPLALSGWGKGKEEAPWPAPKETPLLFGL